MLRDYEDIRSRITDPILWWDDNGVPRYCEFDPSRCGIYDAVAALIEVACQACGKGFLAAVTYDRRTLQELGDAYQRPTPGHVGSFHYGDPPAHRSEGCAAGDTMNVESVRVLQFWEREAGEWRRRPEHEVYIRQPDQVEHGTRTV
jgi:hypothetical protein